MRWTMQVCTTQAGNTVVMARGTPSARRPGYRRIFGEFLLPLRMQNPGKPFLFLEWGVVDSVGAPFNPADMEFDVFTSSDADENGVDDGRETQANIYEGLLPRWQTTQSCFRAPSFTSSGWPAMRGGRTTGPTGGAGPCATSSRRMSSGRRTAPLRHGADAWRIRLKRVREGSAPRASPFEPPASATPEAARDRGHPDLSLPAGAGIPRRPATVE